MNWAFSFNCFLQHRPIKDELAGQGSFPAHLKVGDTAFALPQAPAHTFDQKKKKQMPLNTSSTNAHFIWVEKQKLKAKKFPFGPISCFQIKSITASLLV